MFALFSGNDRPLVLGHRGAPQVAPENTMAGFEKAEREGADGVELDVHRSADGEFVVIHDPTLDRTTDAGGPVSSRTAAELARVDAGWGFAGRDGATPYRGKGVGVPLLDDVLDWARARALVVDVEIKAAADDPGLAADVAEHVATRGDADRVFLSSFSLDQARGATSAVPGVAVALLSIGWDPLEALAAAVDAGCRGLHPDLVSLADAGAERVVAAARAGGCWVAPWTVNDAAGVSRFAAAGVAAVITDDPAMARRALP
ncbi:MAG: glycerophosphodiester phosphodiesterase [Acidimicrobiia bacterium]